MTELYPNAIVLGRGIEIEDGQAYLSLDSMQRAERMAEDYDANWEAYNAGGLIVVSGGHPRLANEEFPTSEADLIADRLMDLGVPHWIIEKETESTSTLANFLNSAEYFANRTITEENPLKVVLQRDHWKRARFFGGKVLDVPMEPVFAPGGGGLRRLTQETVMNAVWHVALAGIENGDQAALLAREEGVNGFAARFRPILAPIMK
jgi:DUF218 domain